MSMVVAAPADWPGGQSEAPATLVSMAKHGISPAGLHGGDAAAVAESLGLDPASMLDLSQNLNPFAPDVEQLVREHAVAVRCYPSTDAAHRLLAEALDVDVNRLRLTNGGSEAIALVAREIGGGVARKPEFSLYPRGRDGPVWRSDPHSPGGSLAGAEVHADVWDEAFYPLATGRWSAARPGVTVGSLTKTFACPGLRLGYVIADDAERMTQNQQKWPIGSLALAVLPELLRQADLIGWHVRIAQQRATLAALLEAYGWPVRAADAPWVLVEADDLRTRLAPLGIVVRDCASFGMHGTFRIAVPNDDGLEAVALALERLAHE